MNYQDWIRNFQATNQTVADIGKDIENTRQSEAQNILNQRLGKLTSDLQSNDPVLQQKALSDLSMLQGQAGQSNTALQHILDTQSLQLKSQQKKGTPLDPEFKKIELERLKKQYSQPESQASQIELEALNPEYINTREDLDRVQKNLDDALKNRNMTKAEGRRIQDSANKWNQVNMDNVFKVQKEYNSDIEKIEKDRQEVKSIRNIFSSGTPLKDVVAQGFLGKLMFGASQTDKEFERIGTSPGISNKLQAFIDRRGGEKNITDKDRPELESILAELEEKQAQLGSVVSKRYIKQSSKAFLKGFSDDEIREILQVNPAYTGEFVKEKQDVSNAALNLNKAGYSSSEYQKWLSDNQTQLQQYQAVIEQKKGSALTEPEKSKAAINLFLKVNPPKGK